MALGNWLVEVVVLLRVLFPVANGTPCVLHISSAFLQPIINDITLLGHRGQMLTLIKTYIYKSPRNPIEFDMCVIFRLTVLIPQLDSTRVVRGYYAQVKTMYSCTTMLLPTHLDSVQPEFPAGRSNQLAMAGSAPIYSPRFPVHRK